MEEKFVIVEFDGVLNNVVTQTFKDMQRIKLVCFDVSSSFIIFGASSGGIYIFKREPCEFWKLIPSKEGSATKILISPNEKYVAIASAKGLIIVLEELFSDTENIDYQIYSVHEGSTITAMKWHSNDLFCGDDAGKVSVISLINLLTKAIFQTPSTFLMTLDSSIIQIDAYTNYILVSTKTQTFICNVEKEQYKQIGKKLRDGEFGACFYKKPKELFPSGGENILTVQDISIYCARPGARLWEANMDGSVEVTYQFKSSLNRSPTPLLQIKDDLEENYQIISSDSIKTVPDNFNFEKIFTICNRFILTFSRDGIYIFDPISSNLAFWINHFDNIKDIAFINSFMYIWRDGWKINTISLLTLEELILKILYKKQYYLCAKICLSFLDDMDNLIKTSTKIYLLSILKSKIKDEDLLMKIEPILQAIEATNECNIKKGKNGVVFIENGYILEELLPESVEIINKETHTKQHSQTISIRYETDVLYKQFKLNKTHANVEIPETEKVLNSLSPEEAYILFNEFAEYCQCKHGEDANLWCQEQFLKLCTKRNVYLGDLSSECLQYLEESFLFVDKTENMSCTCGFPLPQVHKILPKYHVIGQKILDVTDSPEVILKTVPYLFRYKITDMNTSDNFSLLVQYSSIDIFNTFYKKLVYDSWDNIIKFTIRLKNGYCLNCDNKIETKDSISWSELGIIIIKSIGPDNCLKLLKRYSNFIPNGMLGARFYQTSIFAQISSIDNLEARNPSVHFLQNIEEEKTLCKFEQLLEKYLQKRYTGTGDGTNLANKNNINETRCSFCNLLLTMPVLNDITRGQCGHLFHSLCFYRNNYICNMCI